MIRFGKGRDVDLARSVDLDWSEVDVRELEHQNRRAAGLWARLEERDVPGVILGDEVGKGKTYVALAVVYAQLKTKPSSRVLILTHSGHMARIWAERWNEQMPRLCGRGEHSWTEHPKCKNWEATPFKTYEDFEGRARAGAFRGRVLIGSYEVLKKFHNDDEKRRWLLGVLRWAYRSLGIRLSPGEKRRLVSEALDLRIRNLDSSNVPAAKARKILQATFDPERRGWKWGALGELDRHLDTLEGRATKLGKPFDLLVVDEAHKLEGTKRHRVMTYLLDGRFEKCIYVTATPFALSVDEFRRRLRDFRHARSAPKDYSTKIDELALSLFRDAVEVRREFEGQRDLEHELQRRMVRATWNHEAERKIENWSQETNLENYLPSLLLERLIADLLAGGGATHVAGRRETLCSSWAAARKSLDEGFGRETEHVWRDALLQILARRLKRREPDPKMGKVASEIVNIVRAGIESRKIDKVLVFTHRLETSAALKRRLDELLASESVLIQKQAIRWRTRAASVQKALRKLVRSEADAALIAKLIAHAPDRPESSSVKEIRAWWRRHRRALVGNGIAKEWETLRQTVGKGKRLPLVARYDGEAGREETHNREKFNLPCAPLVLIASRKAQEGIDLHHQCRRVVLYDLPWNPANIEQRIGRVHRLGRNRANGKKIQVVYCYQRGTYEERIAERVKQRCQMMQVLLGAGQWLDNDEEIAWMDKYKMVFPAEIPKAGR